jgi:hypothetical protein
MGSIKGQKHNPYLIGKYAHVNQNDVVFTPDWLAKQICEMFPIEGNVLTDMVIADAQHFYDWITKPQ